MKNYGDFSRNLHREFREMDGIKTAFFLTNFRDNFPTLLLVHGINGSHFGLEFLGENLAKNFNLILVDLPGHGDSEIGKFRENISIKTLRKWFTKVAEISQKITKKSDLKIVAHSFGCYAISPEISQKYETVFICPVPTVPDFSRKIAKIMPKIFAKKSLTKFYNWTPFSTIRGDMMLKNASKENREKQYFVAKSDSKTSPEFREFQAKLATKTYPNIFANVHPKLVIFGKYDYVPEEKTRVDYEKVFAKSKIVEVKTGHLPTTEQPEKLAKIIRENLV